MNVTTEYERREAQFVTAALEEIEELAEAAGLDHIVKLIRLVEHVRMGVVDPPAV